MSDNPPPARLLKILIVDDDARFTRLVKLSLERTGKYEVHEDNTGVDALRKALEVRPDLILLDIQMPEISGATLARRMRDHAELRVTPIVYLTAIVPKTEFSAHDELGGFPFLAKPVEHKELLECVAANARAAG